MKLTNQSQRSVMATKVSNKYEIDNNDRKVIQENCKIIDIEKMNVNEILHLLNEKIQKYEKIISICKSIKILKQNYEKYKHILHKENEIKLNIRLLEEKLSFLEKNQSKIQYSEERLLEFLDCKLFILNYFS
jgi:hypothetical protein